MGSSIHGRFCALLYGLFSAFHLGAVDKQMVIVIPSRNNKAVCRENLESVFTQDYKKYIVVYIDDASDDGTAQAVQDVIHEYNQEHRCTVIKRARRRGHMYNHYETVHNCPNNVIVVNLDGDDRFAHTHVLSRINEIYQDDDVWMTYGQYQEWPSGKKGLCDDIPNIVREENAYRYVGWVTSHLRTFYAGLFKAVPIGYFLYADEFQPCAVDYAMMFSMLELSKGRVRFIDEVLYLYNCANPDNIFKKSPLQQMMMGHMSRARRPLKPLSYDPRKPVAKASESARVALIYFSLHDVASAQRCLASAATTHLLHNHNLYLFYEAHTEQERAAYQSLCGSYEHVRGVDMGGQEELKQQLMDICEPYSHLVLFSDASCIHNLSNLREMINTLEKTDAIGFYLGLAKDITRSAFFVHESVQPPLVEIEPNIYAWKFNDSRAEWRFPYTIDSVLYRTSDIRQCIADCSFANYAECAKALSMLGAPRADDVGLCYGHRPSDSSDTHDI
jgi:glycosyltransferase involved in cell wall biosynthesis